MGKIKEFFDLKGKVWLRNRLLTLRQKKSDYSLNVIFEIMVTTDNIYGNA